MAGRERQQTPNTEQRDKFYSMHFTFTPCCDLSSLVTHRFTLVFSSRDNWEEVEDANTSNEAISGAKTINQSDPKG
jgi:hypothetical protein